MASSSRSIVNRAYRLLTSTRTGIVLLIMTGVASAAGTLILQRPLTDPEDLQRVYRPETLRWLDALGLTDVFHSPWFVALLVLLCVNIVLASVERFPEAWRYITRPLRKPEPHFLAGLPLQQEIEITDVRSGVQAAERAFRRMGLKPQRVGKNGDVSLYAERHRFARLSAYVVHASLLLIFAGGIVDALWGYRGFVALTQGETSNQIELRDGKKMTLPFTLRCDDAGQENYADGSPRRWWSKLAVLENGREISRKEIAVNDPLVYRGVRFFQSSYGSTGQVGAVRITATPKADAGHKQELTLRLNESVALDADTTVQMARFVPDFVIRGKEVETRSEEPNNPAIQIVVASKTAGETRIWLFPRFPGFTHPHAAPYTFEVRAMDMGYYTGLQVAHEPGQWGVWMGCALMGIGLVMAFYCIPMRAWAVPVSDGRGRLVLWVGASASKNRGELEERFRKLVKEIQQALAEETRAGAHRASPTMA